MIYAKKHGEFNQQNKSFESSLFVPIPIFLIYQMNIYTSMAISGT